VWNSCCCTVLCVVLVNSCLHSLPPVWASTGSHKKHQPVCSYYLHSNYRTGLSTVQWPFLIPLWHVLHCQWPWRNGVNDLQLAFRAGSALWCHLFPLNNQHRWWLLTVKGQNWFYFQLLLTNLTDMLWVMLLPNYSYSSLPLTVGTNWQVCFCL
jgi:hypothetical protein